MDALYRIESYRVESIVSTHVTQSQQEQLAQVTLERDGLRQELRKMEKEPTGRAKGLSTSTVDNKENSESKYQVKTRRALRSASQGANVLQAGI
jgi:hypothetical protein